MTDQQGSGAMVAAWKDFLPREVLAELLEHVAATQADFKPSTVGHAIGDVVDPSRRISSVSYNLGPFGPAIGQRLLAQAPALSGAIDVPPFVPQLLELELAAHNDGAFFGCHADSHGGRGDGLARLMSGVLYFYREPKAFDGGTLRLYPQGVPGGAAFNEVQPELNTCVFFPSTVPHEVMPVACPSRQFMDSRFAINIWFVGRV